MHPELRKVFDFFSSDDIMIIGSAIHDFDRAHDIDVAFLWDGREWADIGWKDVMRRLRLRYNGWDQDGYHVRRANLRIPGVSKPVQLCHMSHVRRPEDHRWSVMLRDGTVIRNGGRYLK